MRTNKAQILQKAQSYTAKGQVDKAIGEWEKLLSESPNDGNIYNTIGDLCLKKNDREVAIQTYLKAAEIFKDAGFSLKTIAVYKKILKLNPKQHDVYVKLGDLNAERGLTGNAIEDYARIAKVYTQEGDFKEALKVYRKIANLDPANTEIRLKLAEMCVKEGFESDAAAEYLLVAKAYSESGNEKEAEKTYEQVLKLDPSNEDARIALKMVEPELESDGEEVPEQEALFAKAQASIDENQLEEAEKILRQITAQHPSVPSYQEALGRLFIKKDQQFMAFPPLKTAAQIYLQNHEEEKAEGLMEEYLAVVPEQVEARELIAQSLEQRGDQDKALLAYVQVVESYRSVGSMDQARSILAKIQAWNPDHDEIQRLLQEMGDSKSDPSLSLEPLEPGGISQAELSSSKEPVAAHELELSSSKDPVEAVDAKDLLVEADVYIKYGLIDKAIDQLRKAMASSPENLEAQTQLKDLLKSQGQNAEAANICLSMAAIYRQMEDNESYAVLIEEARGLDPGNVRLKEDADLAHLLESGRMDAIMSDGGVEVEAQTTPEPVLEASSSQQEGVEDRAEELLSGSISEHPEAVTQTEASLEHPERSEAPVEMDLAEALEGPVDEVGAIESEIETSLFGRSNDPDLEAAPQNPINDELTLERALDESLAPLSNGEHQTAASEPFRRDSAATGSGEGEFVDLSEVLGKELEEVATFDHDSASRGESLQSAISDFHEKEEAKPADEVDCETRYNLGIAYSEMGLISEAIEEFKKSAKSSNRYIDSSSMLSACYRRKGMTFEAIQILEEALADPRLEDPQQEWLWYDLAQLYEHDHRLQESLALYAKIYKKDDAFKDVVERLKALCSQLGKSPDEYISEKNAQAIEEDADSMIDRIFGESTPGPSEPKKKQSVKKKTRISYL